MVLAENKLNPADKTPSPRPIRIWRAYLLIWLSAVVPLIAVHLLARLNYIKVSSSIFAGVTNLFGPFATFVLAMSDFPNAGEFPMLHLPYTCVATAAMIIIMVLPSFFRQRWVRISCIVVFVPLLLGWLALGFYQISHCAT